MMEGNLLDLTKSNGSALETFKAVDHAYPRHLHVCPHLPLLARHSIHRTLALGFHFHRTACAFLAKLTLSTAA
jgi:hypothetical protein